MSDEKIFDLRPEEAVKLSNMELLKHCIKKQKAYAETLPTKKKRELLQQLIAIENRDFFHPTRIDSSKSLIWVYDIDKLIILQQRQEVKSLFKEMHKLSKKLKNRCLRKISIGEQKLKQMEYNYKHGIKETIPILNDSQLSKIAEELSEVNISEAVDRAIKRFHELKLKDPMPQKLVEVTW